MSGIGESLVLDARLEDLQRMIIIGVIKDYDTAKKAYPSLKEEIFKKYSTLFTTIFQNNYY